MGKLVAVQQVVMALAFISPIIQFFCPLDMREGDITELFLLNNSIDGSVIHAMPFVLNYQQSSSQGYNNREKFLVGW